MAQPNELVVALRLVADQFQSDLKKSDSALGGFTETLKKLATNGKVQLTALTVSLIEIAKATASWGEEIDHLSQRTGLGIEDMEAWSVALAHAGLEGNDLAMGVKNLAKHIEEAGDPTSAIAATFKQWGIEVKNASVESVLEQIAQRLSETEDGFAKTAFAQQTMGKLGEKLIPLFNEVGGNFDAVKAKAHAMGLVLGAETVKELTETEKSVKNVGLALTGLKINIGAELSPALKLAADGLTWFIEKMTNAVRWAGIFRIEGRALIDTLIEVASALTDIVPLQLKKMLVFTPDDADRAAIDKQIEAIAKRAAETIARIGAEADADIGAIGEGRQPDAKKKPPKKQPEFESRKKALEAELKEREQVLAEELRAAKNTADLEAAYTAANIASRLITETEGAQQIQDQHLVEWTAFKALLAREGEALADFYKKRVALGFKDTEDRKAFESDYATKLSKLREKASTEGTAFIKKGVTDQETIRKATEEQQAKLLASAVRVEDEKTKAMELALVPREAIAEQELNLLRAKHAEELNLLQEKLAHEIGNEQQAAAVVAAVRGRQAAEIAAKEIEAHGGFFANYVQGLKKFVNDNDTGFGLARQMAIETAQAMTQAFQTFFFDLFTGKIQSMKDMLRSFLDFALKIISQVLAQMAATGLLKGGLSILAPFLNANFNTSPTGGPINFGQGGELGPGINTVVFTPHAAGGVFSTPHMGLVAEQGPEAIAPLGDLLAAIRDKGTGTGNVSISVQINTGGTTKQSGGNSMPNMQQFARQIGKMLEDKIIDEQRPGGLLAAGA